MGRLQECLKRLTTPNPDRVNTYVVAERERLRLLENSKKRKELRRELKTIGAAKLLNEVRKNVWIFGQLSELDITNWNNGHDEVVGLKTALIYSYTRKESTGSTWMREILHPALPYRGENKQWFPSDPEPVTYTELLSIGIQEIGEHEVYLRGGYFAGKYFVLESWSMRDVILKGRQEIDPKTQDKVLIPVTDKNALEDIKDFLKKDNDRRIATRHLP